MNTQPWSEAHLLFYTVAMGIVGGLAGAVPIFALRWWKGDPLIQREKLTSPVILYFGILLFGGFGIMSFATRMPLFGAAFLLASGAYGVGVIAYRRGWRG